MNITQEQYKECILNLAEWIGVKPAFEEIVSTLGIYKATQDLVFELFLDGIDALIRNLATQDRLDEFQQIRNYCAEMRIDGYVNFAK